MLRYFCEDNVAEVSRGFRLALSQKSWYSCIECVVESSPQPPKFFDLSAGAGWGPVAGLGETGEWRARAAAVAQPPSAEQWGTGGVKGLAWWYFSFFPPPFISILEKKKPYGIKATMKGFWDAECAAG